MNIEIIEDNVAQYNDALFSELFTIIDENIAFINTNDLIVPKPNYLLSLPFLNTTMNHFTSLDYKFADKTLKKLHTDINYIYKHYQAQIEDGKNFDELFQKKFLPKIRIFKQMQERIQKIQNATLINNDDDKKTIKMIQRHDKEMREIYYNVFKEDYLEQTSDILNNLKIILNTKIFYLDRMLWINAVKSEYVVKFLKSLKLSGNMNSKKYLTYRIKVALPYTDDYKYLQKCLRIHK